MDIQTLKTTPAEPHVFLRGIVDADRAQPVTEIQVGGRSVRVGDTFVPTLYWLGRNSKLLHPVWEYDVENRNGRRTTTEPNPQDRVIDFRELDPYIMPLSVIEGRRESSALEEIAGALVSGTDMEIRKALIGLGVDVPVGEARGAARATLKLKGYAGAVSVPAPLRAPVPAPADPATGPLDELRQAYDAEDFNALGRALKKLGAEIPKGQSKVDRIESARQLLEG